MAEVPRGAGSQRQEVDWRVPGASGTGGALLLRGGGTSVWGADEVLEIVVGVAQHRKGSSCHRTVLHFHTVKTITFISYVFTTIFLKSNNVIHQKPLKCTLEVGELYETRYQKSCLPKKRTNEVVMLLKMGTKKTDHIGKESELI